LVKIRKWKDIPQHRLNTVLQYIAYDFAKPKSKSEIFEHVKKMGIKTRVSLDVYLAKLEKENYIKSVISNNWKRVRYELADKKFWNNFEKKYERKMSGSKKRIFKETEKLIRDIERGKRPKECVLGDALYALTAFEMRQLEGFELLLEGKTIAPFVTPALVEDYLIMPFNLAVQLLWACHIKDKEKTIEAINLLKKYKSETLKPFRKATSG
jgi:hypothetical protein